VIIADAQTGQVRTVITETDSAWIQQFDELRFLNGARTSCGSRMRSGWTQLYLFPRDGGARGPLTSGISTCSACSGVDTIGSGLLHGVTGQSHAALPLSHQLTTSVVRRSASRRTTEPGFHS